MGLDSGDKTSVFQKVGVVVVGVLVSIALVLGYFLYKNVIQDAPVSPYQTERQDTDAESFDFPAPTDDERVALDMSPANMFTQPAAVQKVAIASKSLAIGADCRVSPVVPKVQQGTPLELKNYDSTPHTITVNIPTSKAHAYLVPAQGSTIVDIDFGEMGGSFSTYSMSCDESPTIIGIMMIVP